MPKQIIVVFTKGVFVFVDSDDPETVEAELARRGIMRGSIGTATAYTLDELRDPAIGNLIGNQVEPLALQIRGLEFAKVDAHEFLHTPDDDD